MNEEEIEIARAFVKCIAWQWLPGMRAVGREGYPAAWLRVEEPLQRLSGVWRDAAPDITDPATLGCIVQVVRDAMGDPGLHVRCTLPYVPSYNSAPPWVVCSGRGQRLSDRHTTEAKALLQVLQAAPEAISG